MILRWKVLDIPGNSSPNSNAPSTAVKPKLALVLITLTRTVLFASVRARVNRPHITPLKARFMARKNCLDISSILDYRDCSCDIDDSYPSDKEIDQCIRFPQAKQIRNARRPGTGQSCGRELCEDAVKSSTTTRCDGIKQPLRPGLMLYDFHTKQNARKPGAVHATYLITGTKRPTASTRTNGAHSQNDEDSVHQDRKNTKHVRRCCRRCSGPISNSGPK
nr:hypothetical protein CFP56_12043 [Quercus suber]